MPSGSVVQLCMIGTRAHQVSHLGVCVVVLVVDVYGVEQPHTAVQPRPRRRGAWDTRDFHEGSAGQTHRQCLTPWCYESRVVLWQWQLVDEGVGRWRLPMIRSQRTYIIIDRQSEDNCECNEGSVCVSHLVQTVVARYVDTLWASDVQLLVAVVDTTDEDRAGKKRGLTHHGEVAVRVVVHRLRITSCLLSWPPQSDEDRARESKSVVQRCGCVSRCPGSGCERRTD